MSSCSLSPATFPMLRVGKVFEDVVMEKSRISTPFFGTVNGTAPLISTMEYDKSGSVLLAASESVDALFVFEAITNPELRSVHKISRTGIGLLRAGHHASILYHSTARLEDTIKYLSISENKYIATFSGHKRRIVSLELSPRDDTILTGAVDDSVMLWDPRIPQAPIASIPLVTGTPLVGFDPQGIVIGVALSHNRTIRLYDARAYERGPFSIWELPVTSPLASNWTRLAFSNDGNYILISGRSHHFSISAWDGSSRAVYALPGTTTGASSPQGLAAAISPDSQFIYGPIGDNRVAFWESITGKGISLIETGHNRPISTVAFNPQYATMATACSSIVRHPLTSHRHYGTFLSQIKTSLGKEIRPDMEEI